MTSKNVEHLMVVDNDEAVGFMEIENHKLEMLFIASNQRGKGLGKALLQYGMKNYDVCELTVNEQNPQAIGFYEVMGFKTYKKTELDEAGNPYPLLYMKLDRSDFIELFKKLIIMNMKKEQQTVHLGF